MLSWFRHQKLSFGRRSCPIIHKWRGALALPHFGQWIGQQGGQQGVSAQALRQLYINHLKELRDEHELIRVSWTENDSDELWADLIAFIKEAPEKSVLHVLAYRKSIEFSNLKFAGLVIRASAKLVLHDCEIGVLAIGEVDDKANQKVSVDKCNIGRIELAKNIGQVAFSNTTLHTILAQPAALKIAGPVFFKNVKFSNKSSQVQQFRTLEAKLLEINNVVPAGILHAADLRASRDRDNKMERFIGWVYDTLSAYGTSIIRPIVSLLLFLFLNILFLYELQATVDIPLRQLDGWQSSLVGSDWTANLARASYLSLGQTFNPFGILGSQTLVITKSLWIATVSTILCALGTLSFGLLILAIRRRFRLGGV